MTPVVGSLPAGTPTALRKPRGGRSHLGGDSNSWEWARPPQVGTIPHFYRSCRATAGGGHDLRVRSRMPPTSDADAAPSGSAALRRQDTSCGDNASQPGALRSDSRRCCGCWSPASGWPDCWFSTPYRCTPASRTRPRLLATTRSSATRRGRAPWGSPERVARAPDRGFDDGCRYQCICPPPRTPSYAQPARVGLGDRVKAAAGLPGGFQGRDQPAFATAGPPRTRDSDRSCVPRQRRWASAAHR